jgi:alpha-D-ribose 1-methylphosphonate 5-triphosphate diphosphatase
MSTPAATYQGCAGSGHYYEENAAISTYGLWRFRVATPLWLYPDAGAIHRRRGEHRTALDDNDGTSRNRHQSANKSCYLIRMILHIHNGRILRKDVMLAEGALTIERGIVTAIGSPAPRGALSLDARGMLVLPGIVDLHGDAFERQLMPRPGVAIDPHVALLDTDRQLLANGITTAYHAMTWSWEPGLRSRETGTAFVAALTAARPALGCDTRFHLRHETYNLDGEQAVVDWLAAGHIDLLAINDHTPGMAAKVDRGVSLAATAERAGLSLAAFSALLAAVVGRKPAVANSIGRICGAAAAQGVPMASHDDASAATRDAYGALGCTICEFPQTVETARHARATGASVVMGAPNVLRGGSHIGLVGAADLVARGLCDILCSDYYYPALLGAPFRLAHDGVCDLADAWRLVSANPAAAAGLDDRGALEPGARADVVLIDDSAGAPRVAATFVAGEPAFFTAGFDRLSGIEPHAMQREAVSA